MAKKRMRKPIRAKAKTGRKGGRAVRRTARGTKYVYFFGNGKADGERRMRDTLGGKGAGLAEMTNAGLPVPPGFTLSTDVCALYYAKNGKIPSAVETEIAGNIRKLEKAAGATLGSTRNPLLVSVRSGSKFSMPGMMDTILNLGLNDAAVEGLKARTSTAGLRLTATAGSCRCSAASCSRFPKACSSTSSTR